MATVITSLRLYLVDFSVKYLAVGLYSLKLLIPPFGNWLLSNSQRVKGDIAPNQVIARSEFEVHREMYTE